MADAGRLKKTEADGATDVFNLDRYVPAFLTWIANKLSRGRALHDQIKGIALERERAFLAVLSDPERETLIGLLKRLHENLPAVEVATESYVAQRFPKAARNRARTEENDE